MQEAILLIASIQGWLYALLIMAGAIYLRSALNWHAAVRSSQFGLERERASTKRFRALAMLGLVSLAGIATFVLSTFLVPGLPALERPTQIPTISLLEASSPVATAVQTPDGSGCLNVEATISSPAAGDEIRGLVEISGTANIPSFAFYKIEVKESGPTAVFQVITAGTEARVDDILGVWDTSLVENGVYLLQLVVTDTQGNAPHPCTIELVVLPTGG
jgi:hypothetical protein